MSRDRAATVLAAAALVFLSLELVRDHARDDSLSADEPVHILSGWLEVSGRNAIVNIEHPPLAKILAGLSLRSLALPPPPPVIPMGTRFTDFGHEFLFENRVSPDAIAAAARAPFRGVLAALLLLLFAAAWSRYGPAAALVALLLVALDPNFVAHAGVVHTDVGASLGFLAAVLSWEAARRRPTLLRLALAALALGLALATKFSAILLPPILLLQSLLASRRDPRPGRAATRAVLRLAAVVMGALVVVLAVYAPLSARMNPDHQRAVIHEMVAGRGAPRLSAAIESLVPVSRPLAHYLGGLASVLRQSAVGGGVNYLFGKSSVHGFPFYFFAAFALKSSIAFLAVTAVTLVSFLRRPAGLAEEARLFLLPPAIFFSPRSAPPTTSASGTCSRSTRSSPSRQRPSSCARPQREAGPHAGGRPRRRSPCSRFRSWPVTSSSGSIPTSFPTSMLLRAVRRTDESSCPTRTWTGVSI